MPEYILHKVKKGETVWSISRKYKVEEHKIVQANPEKIQLKKIKGKYEPVIYEGDILRIPQKEEQTIYIIKGNTSLGMGEPGEYELLDKEGRIPHYPPEKIFWTFSADEGAGSWRILRLEKEKTGQKFSIVFTNQKLKDKKIQIQAFVKREKGTEKLSELIITLDGEDLPEIKGLDLLDANRNLVKRKLSYAETVYARARCTGMEGETLSFSLWEDDAPGAGHSKENEENLIQTKQAEVKDGLAEVSFSLIYSVMAPIANRKIPKGQKDEGKYHEYYVTVGRLGKIEKASSNADVNNPDYIPPPPKPKPKTESSKKPSSSKKTPSTRDKSIEDQYKEIIETAINTANEVNRIASGNTTHIKKVYFTDVNGKVFTRKPKYGETIRLYIEGTNLKDKNIQVELWEDDRVYGKIGTGKNDDLLYKAILPLVSSTVNYISIPFTKGMQEKGDDLTEGSEQEIYARITLFKTNQKVVSGLITVDTNDFSIPEPEGISPVTKKNNKKKFDKVKEYGEEAIIYVTNIIATSIKINKNGQVISYPDYGGYNGMNEYKEGDNIYCKKNIVKGVIKSIFPTYKAYIYRGNKKGEAIEKLKQDIKNNTFENAESTVLELARHVASKNLSYDSEGLTPPNDINNLYEIKYQYGVSKGRPSFRYRIVENRVKNSLNFPKIKTLSQEVYNGNMAIGKRSSMSFDPWRSNALIGCLGFKGDGGDYHPSCAIRAKNDYNDKVKYKFIYHALNNYLETVIPELTGIYGRRGFNSIGEVNVLASKYDHEIQVFMLIDTLPELKKKDGLFTEEDARKALRVIYDKYGVEIAKNVEMMYRWECEHFKSGQYKYCGGPGMEAANSNHPTYGWNGDVYKKYPQYTPVGLWDAYENKGMSGKGGNTQVTDKKKNYVKFPSVEAGMVYVAEFLLRYNGNVGRWHSKDDSTVQDNYKKNINTTIPRIVNSFK